MCSLPLLYTYDCMTNKTDSHREFFSIFGIFVLWGYVLVTFISYGWHN